MSEKRYIIYDSRAEYDEDEATVYASSMTLVEPQTSLSAKPATGT